MIKSATRTPTPLHISTRFLEILGPLLDTTYIQQTTFVEISPLKVKSLSFQKLLGFLILFAVLYDSYASSGSSGSSGNSNPPGFSNLDDCENQVNIFHSVRPGKSYQASPQYRVTIGPPAKLYFNGVPLAGRWYPAFRCLLGIYASGTFCVFRTEILAHSQWNLCAFSPILKKSQS